VLVAAPEPAAVDEALFFHERLVQQNMPFSGFVVNRVHPQMRESPEPAELERALGARPELAAMPPGDPAAAVAPLLAAYHDFGVLAEADRLQILRLHQIAPEQPLATVAIQERDVHDVESLSALGRAIFPK
jgi:anion-transporting  ArsA/GET3 family ATPase